MPIQAPSAESALLGANTTRSNLARIQGVAESYEVLSRVAKAHQTEVKTVKRGLSFEIDSDTAQLEVTLEDPSKEKALAMLTDLLKETRLLFSGLVSDTTSSLLSSLTTRQKELEAKVAASEGSRSKSMAENKSSGDDRTGVPVLDQLRLAEGKIIETEAAIKEVREKELRALSAEEAVMASTSRIFEGKTLLEVRAEAQIAAARFAPGAVEYQLKHKALSVAEGLVKQTIAAKRDAIMKDATPALKELTVNLTELKSSQKSLKAAAETFTSGRETMLSLSRSIEGDAAALTQLRAGIEDARAKSIVAAVGWATLQYPKLEDEPVKKPILELGILALLVVSFISGLVQVYWPFGKRG